MRLQHTQFQTVISAINCFYNINNFVVAALFGTQTFHWFAFRGCPPLSYPTPFDRYPHNQTVLHFIRTLVYSELLRLSERKHFIGLHFEGNYPRVWASSPAVSLQAFSSSAPHLFLRTGTPNWHPTRTKFYGDPVHPDRLIATSIQLLCSPSFFAGGTPTPPVRYRVLGMPTACCKKNCKESEVSDPLGRFWRFIASGGFG